MLLKLAEKERLSATLTWYEQVAWWLW